MRFVYGLTSCHTADSENTRVDMLWSRCILMELCPCIRSLVSLVVIPWVLYVSDWFLDAGRYL
jgi:hypothetical protein